MKPRIVTGSPFPRIMDSLVFPHSVVTSVRLNVRRAEGDTKGIIFLCFAICFLSYEAIIYDADHHNFELRKLRSGAAAQQKTRAARPGMLAAAPALHEQWRACGILQRVD